MPTAFFEGLQEGNAFANAFTDRRRKDAAFNALRAAYGDTAGDPEAAASLQQTQQRAQAFPLAQAQAQQELAQSAELQPLKVQGAQVDIAGKQADTALNQDKLRNAAALRAVRVLKATAEEGGDLAGMFDRLTPTLPALGVSEKDIPALKALVLQNPAKLDEIAAALQTQAAVPSTRFQITQDEQGNLYRVTAEGAEPVLDSSGNQVKAYQAPAAAARIQQADERMQLTRDLASPELRGAQAEASAAGKVAGTTAANLPNFEAVITSARTRIAEVRKEPALDAIFGSPTLKKMLGQGGFGAFGALPGTPAADAAAKVTALVSQLRSQAYETLKGGGQITEAESRFAAEALANLERAQSKQSFERELDNLETVLDRAEAAARAKAKLPLKSEAPPAAPSGFKYLGKE